MEFQVFARTIALFAIATAASATWADDPKAPSDPARPGIEEEDGGPRRPPPPRRGEFDGPRPGRPSEGRPSEGRPSEGRPGDRPPRREGDGPGPGERPPRRPGEGPPPPGHEGRPPPPPHEMMEQMKEHDPEMYEFFEKEREIDRKSMAISQRLRQAPKAEREKSRSELKELVSEMFRVRQGRRKLELTRLEDQLKRLKESHERREQNSEDLIRKRVSELLGEREDLDF